MMPGITHGPDPVFPFPTQRQEPATRDEQERQEMHL